MRALVTGATGFLGAHLVHRLVTAGETVAILRRSDSDPWRIRSELPKLWQIDGDMRTIYASRSAIDNFRPDTVFHLAWEGVAGRCRNDARQITDNLQGTVNLLQMAVDLGCLTWVAIGSQAEYGPHNDAIDETAATMPTTRYGAAKLDAYLQTRRIAAASQIRYVWLRLFSAYGPQDGPDWMIPQIIESLLDGCKPSLTLGEQQWDFVYVKDAVEAIYRVGACRTASGLYNLGSGTTASIRNIAERIRDLIDPALPLGFGEIPYRPDQVMHLQADIAHLTADTGWTPDTCLQVGLGETVRWHRRRRRGSP